MTPELSKALNELAVVLISCITTIFIPWAFKIGREYAQAKIQHVQNAEARSILQFALERLDSTAKTVVDEINQKLKARDQDGKIPPDLAKKLIQIAYARTMLRLPEGVKSALDASYGDKLHEVITGKIESKVSDAKALNACCNPPPVAVGLRPAGGGSVLTGS